MTDEELDRISRKLELASAEFADANHPGKLWEWVLPLCDIGNTLISEVRRLKAENKWLRRFHQAGCPAVADDEGDAVLDDYQECACQFETNEKRSICAEEREACARIAETISGGWVTDPTPAKAVKVCIATAIRARGKK